MVPQWGRMDMVWIDPADEECFESVLSVLHRGNFDVVLDAIGKKIDLDGLMVSGIGLIFLSHLSMIRSTNKYTRIWLKLRVHFTM